LIIVCVYACCRRVDAATAVVIVIVVIAVVATAVAAVAAASLPWLKFVRVGRWHKDGDQ
jgi:hypothetical protein